MPPISVVFAITGLAAWANGLYFLGIGTKQEEGGPDPLVSVGWVSLTAGVVNLGSVLWFVGQGDGPHVLAGLVTFYGAFFTALGLTEILGLDLRQIGNIAVAVAIVPLFWLDFLSGSARIKRNDFRLLNGEIRVFELAHLTVAPHTTSHQDHNQQPGNNFVLYGIRADVHNRSLFLLLRGCVSRSTQGRRVAARLVRSVAVR